MKVVNNSQNESFSLYGENCAKYPAKSCGSIYLRLHYASTRLLCLESVKEWIWFVREKRGLAVPNTFITYRYLYIKYHGCFWFSFLMIRTNIIWAHAQAIKLWLFWSSECDNIYGFLKALIKDWELCAPSEIIVFFTSIGLNKYVTENNSISQKNVSSKIQVHKWLNDISGATEHVHPPSTPHPPRNAAASYSGSIKSNMETGLFEDKNKSCVLLCAGVSGPVPHRGGDLPDVAAQRTS